MTPNGENIGLFKFQNVLKTDLEQLNISFQYLLDFEKSQNVPFEANLTLVCAIFDMTARDEVLNQQGNHRLIELSQMLRGGLDIIISYFLLYNHC